MYKNYILVSIVGMFLFFDWHARMVFMACAYRRRYGHGKSWNRAHKHYKRNWTIFERILWLFIFNEYYESKYKAIAYLSYVHAFLAIISVCWFVVSTIFYPGAKAWIYVYIAYSVFTLLRFIYNNSIARGII